MIFEKSFFFFFTILYFLQNKLIIEYEDTDFETHEINN